MGTSATNTREDNIRASATLWVLNFLVLPLWFRLTTSAHAL